MTLPSIPLTAGGTHVEIVPALGGKIARLELGGREWLWTSDVIAREAPTAAMAADDDVSYVHVADTGGWDECLPTVGACRLPADVAGFGGLALPDHGELWTQDAATSPVTERGSGAAAITRWTGRRMPYSLVRTVRVEGDGSVQLHYALTNDGDAALPFLWSSHPLLPLTPDTLFELPVAARVRVWAQHGIDLGGEGAEHRWPMLRVGGREVDFTRPGLVPGAWACKLFLDLPRPQARPLRVAVAQGGARLVFELEPADVPSLGLWLNHGGWTPFDGGVPYMNLAFEPCIGAPDPLDAALGAWRGAHWLPPRETRRWGLTLRAR
jgi:hypothetical protein